MTTVKNKLARLQHREAALGIRFGGPGGEEEEAERVRGLADSQCREGVGTCCVGICRVGFAAESTADATSARLLRLGMAHQLLVLTACCAARQNKHPLLTRPQQTTASFADLFGRKVSTTNQQHGHSRGGRTEQAAGCGSAAHGWHGLRASWRRQRSPGVSTKLASAVGGGWMRREEELGRGGGGRKGSGREWRKSGQKGEGDREKDH